jgi:hypothetical protein
MPMMNVRHVSMLVLGAGMCVFVGVNHIGGVMRMELIMAVSMFVNNRHMDMEMCMLFICQ